MLDPDPTEPVSADEFATHTGLRLSVAETSKTSRENSVGKPKYVNRLGNFAGCALILLLYIFTEIVTVPSS